MERVLREGIGGPHRLAGRETQSRNTLGQGAAMRRFVIVLAGTPLIMFGLACQHTGGKCDCSPIVPQCAKYGLYPDSAHGTVTAEPTKSESLPPVQSKPAVK
jgi:hypothetical protein